ncbi:hypothetical protein [Halomicrobium zhouii]|nr:hypothetical protein [Halomicrobium zhouii]
MGRTFGYETRPKDDNTDTITKARKRRAREKYGDSCILCDSDDEIGYVRIVPPKFWGIADAPNLVPFCSTHKPRHHVFLDISYPGKWMRFPDLVDWKAYTSSLKEQLLEAGHEGTAFVDHLDELLEVGQVPPRDPYWLAKNVEDTLDASQ